MATKTIAQLPAAASLTDNDLYEIDDGANSRKVTGAQIKAFVRLGLTKADVGLTNVDNTSDVNKPVSTAQAAADAAILAAAIQRANHTGTQTASTISDFAAAASSASPVQSVAGKTGVVTLVKADVGLGNVDNTSDVNKPVSTAQAAADAAVLAAAAALVDDLSGVTNPGGARTSLGLGSSATLDAGSANGVATLDGAGKIPSAQLPAIAITSTYGVASQAAMLALTAQTGDVAIRSDLNKCFILQGTDPTVLGDWAELLTPTDAVLSVNGSTGAVTISAAGLGALVAANNLSDLANTATARTNIGLGNVDNTSDANKPVSTAQAAADAVVQAYAIQRANHTGTQTASTISDFNSAARAQVEAELVAGTNITITPSGSGATRQLTIAASGGGGATTWNDIKGDAVTDLIGRVNTSTGTTGEDRIGVAREFESIQVTATGGPGDVTVFAPSSGEYILTSLRLYIDAWTGMTPGGGANVTPKIGSTNIATAIFVSVGATNVAVGAWWAFSMITGAIPPIKAGGSNNLILNVASGLTGTDGKFRLVANLVKVKA